MSQAPIVFDGVWKKFQRGERHDSLRDLIPAAVRRMLGRARPASRARPGGRGRTTRSRSRRDVPYCPIA